MFYETVKCYLESRGEIPLSVKHISNKLKVKKRCIIAICNEEKMIKKVHPSHCGSGRDHASIFIYSTNDKWETMKLSEPYEKNKDISSEWSMVNVN